MSFHFDVIHRPGIANILPDHLSRLFSTDQMPTYSTVDVESTDKHNIDDAQLGALNVCVSDSIPMCVSYMNLDPKEAEQKVVPEAACSEMLDLIHARGHFGAVAMVKAIHEVSRNQDQQAQEMIFSLSGRDWSGWTRQIETGRQDGVGEAKVPK